MISLNINGIIGLTSFTDNLIHSQNKEFIEQARELYFDACKYSRKKKKAIRKKALYDYNFWTAINKNKYF